MRGRAARRPARPSRRPPPPPPSARASCGPCSSSELRQPRRQRRVVGEEMRVLLLQQRDAQRRAACRRRVHGDARIASSSASGTCTVPILLALRFDVDRTRRIEALPSRRAGRSRTPSATAADRRADRPAASRDAAASAFEVERLRAFGGERGEQAALARAGEAADRPRNGSAPAARQPRDDVAAIRAVAAVELHRAPADLVQHVRQRAAALAAAPAVHERRPVARLVGERGLEHRARCCARPARRRRAWRRRPTPARAAVPMRARSPSSSTGWLTAPGM